MEPPTRGFHGFQTIWSFQDGPASALPLTEILTDIYDRKSTSPDVPEVDEAQVRRRADVNESELWIF